VQILLVDDHELFRSGMATALRTLDEDISILEADCIASARPVIEANHRAIDLVLLDYEMPDGNGITFLQRIRQDYPLLPVAMLSAVENVRLMTQSLEAGALGFIPKVTSTSVILPAIQLMLSGGTYIPPTMLPALALSAFSEPAQADKADEDLTERQLEVLGLIAQGLSNKDIAWRLKIAEGTVKVHVSVILKARGLSSRKLLIASAA